MRKLFLHGKGFTLIELLVVISIIALLSSVVLASLNSARSKSRDARRLADNVQLRSALELYANDNGGSYPSTGGSWWGTCSGFGSHTTSGASGWVPNLAPTYVSVLPTDPKQIDNSSCYLYNSNGVDYMLLVYRTVENLPIKASLRRPSNTGESDYAFYTAGAAGW